MTIIQATTIEHLEGVRLLMRAFLDWQRVRHIEEIAVVDDYFDADAFEAELANLPGDYGPPGGRLLIAVSDTLPEGNISTIAGCVALHDLGSGVCEMKRMFVSQDYLGQGLGRKLATAIIQAGRDIGYTHMRLDTGARQVEAQGLYASMGFKPIEAYYDMPADVKDWLVFMELDLLA